MRIYKQLLFNKINRFKMNIYLLVSYLSWLPKKFLVNEAFIIVNFSLCLNPPSLPKGERIY